MQELNDRQKTCINCAACCKDFAFYITSKGMAWRLQNLVTNDIIVKKVNNRLWQVKINLPCLYLEENQDETYGCSIYDKRPMICRKYPNHIDKDIKEYEKDNCRLIQMEANKDGIRKNGRNR